MIEKILNQNFGDLRWRVKVYEHANRVGKRPIFTDRYEEGWLEQWTNQHRDETNEGEALHRDVRPHAIGRIEVTEQKAELVKP